MSTMLRYPSCRVQGVLLSQNESRYKLREASFVECHRHQHDVVVQSFVSCIFLSTTQGKSCKLRKLPAKRTVVVGEARGVEQRY